MEHEEWGEVAAHARLVLEENSTLLRQQELQREQAKEMRREHQAIGWLQKEQGWGRNK